MEQEILAYLNSQSGYDWIKLNDFLKQHYGDTLCNEIRTSLVNLTQQGKIEIQDNAHLRMCNKVQLHQTDTQNTQATLDNWQLLAKIKEPGRQYLADTEMKWYKSELAKKQFQDYPRNKQLAEDSHGLAKKSLNNARTANIISIATLVVIPLILWLLKHYKLWPFQN